MKIIAFIATFFAAVACLLQPASGGTMSLNVTTFPDSQTVDLTTSANYAVWGVDGNASWTDYSAGSLIDANLYTLGEGGAFQELGPSNAGNLYQLPTGNVYGGIEYSSFPSGAVGSGYEIQVNADPTQTITFSVWGWNSNGAATVNGYLAPWMQGLEGYEQYNPVSTVIAPNTLWRADFTASPGNSTLYLDFVLSSDVAEVGTPNISVAAIAAAPAPTPVPEVDPSMFCTSAILAIGSLFLMEDRRKRC